MASAPRRADVRTSHEATTSHEAMEKERPHIDVTWISLGWGVGMIVSTIGRQWIPPDHKADRHEHTPPYLLDGFDSRR